MCDKFHPNQCMQNLILWHLSIQSDLETKRIVVIVRTSRSFSWFLMNELMTKMQSWFFGVPKMVIFSSSKVKIWVRNEVSTKVFHAIFDVRVSNFIKVKVLIFFPIVLQLKFVVNLGTLIPNSFSSLFFFFV